MAFATKAALSAPNVVVLPTAATHRVDNDRYAAQRQAKRALRDAEPWPGEHRWPFLRQRAEEDRLVATTTRSPELLIVMTMFELMGTDKQEELAAKVASYAAQMADDASAAAAIITSRLAKASRGAAELIRDNAEQGSR